jgi:hypothetical protein
MTESVQLYLRHDGLRGSRDVSQATGSSRILDFTSAPPGLHLFCDYRFGRGTTGGLNLPSDARHRIIKAITDRAIVVVFFKVDPNPQLCFLDLNTGGKVNNRTADVTAKLVRCTAEFLRRYGFFYHRADSRK